MSGFTCVGPEDSHLRVKAKGGCFLAENPYTGIGASEDLALDHESVEYMIRKSVDSQIQ